MKECLLPMIKEIQNLAKVAEANFNKDREQNLLDTIWSIRQISWAIKEEVFKTRLLDAKINGRVKIRARARYVSTTFDDLLDLL